MHKYGLSMEVRPCIGLRRSSICGRTHDRDGREKEEHGGTDGDKEGFQASTIGDRIFVLPLPSCERSASCVDTKISDFSSKTRLLQVISNFGTTSWLVNSSTVRRLVSATSFL